MGVETLRPDGTSTNPFSVVGAASADAALSDDSDSSYVAGADATGGALFTLAAAGFPSSAKVVGVRAKVRRRSSSGGTTANVVVFFVNSSRAVLALTAGTSSATFVDSTGMWAVTNPDGDPWTLADVDSLAINLRHGSTTAAETAELWVEVDYNERPVATIDPLGTVTDTSEPTVTWDYTDPEDDPQEAYRVVVYDADDTAVYDSGWVFSSATEQQLPTLTNGQTYRATVQVRQQWSGEGNHESAVSEDTFTLDLDTPDPPDVVVVEYPDDAFLTLEVSDPTVAPDPVAEWFSVEYRDDPADDWTVLRGASELDVGGLVLVADYEAPFGVERTYRVRAYTDVSGQTVASDPTVTAVTLDASGRWITDPRDPETLHVKVKTREQARQWDGRETVHYPAGMDVAVVESESPVFGQTLSVLSLDPAEQTVLVGALTSTRPLLYRDRRTTIYFRWYGTRTATQIGPDATDADAFTGNMVQIARPS